MEASEEGSGEKERAKWKRDGTDSGWDEALTLTEERGRKGFAAALGAFDKGGVARSVDEGSG